VKSHLDQRRKGHYRDQGQRYRPDQNSRSEKQAREYACRAAAARCADSESQRGHQYGYEQRLGHERMLGEQLRTQDGDEQAGCDAYQATSKASAHPESRGDRDQSQEMLE
jgi:hypothetical protein